MICRQTRTELNEIGDDPRYASEIDRLRELHFAWSRQHHRRITKDAETVEKMMKAKSLPALLLAIGMRNYG